MLPTSFVVVAVVVVGGGIAAAVASRYACAPHNLLPESVSIVC